MAAETLEVRTVTGRVVSNKMDKTITVLVERRVKHPVVWQVHARSIEGARA
jgi:small subunit ribosomal protein S17